jgi:hypothetical protein
MNNASKTVNLLKETNTLIKYINELGSRYESLDTAYSKQMLLSKVLKYKFDLHLQENGLTICDIEVYALLIECMQKLIEDLNMEFETSRIYLRYCNHRHAFTPTQAYAGVALELWEHNEKESFFYLMLSPYIGEFGCVEVGLSVKCTNIKGIMLLRKYKEVNDKIKKTITVTNISPANLYLYVLSCKMYNTSLSKRCKNYKAEFDALKNYALQMNSHFGDLDLVLNDDGFFTWNRKYKLKEIIKQVKNVIKFPDISCFLYE